MPVLQTKVELIYLFNKLIIMILQDFETKIDGANKSGASKPQEAPNSEQKQAQAGKRKLSKSEYMNIAAGAGGAVAGIAGAAIVMSFREPPATSEPPVPPTQGATPAPLPEPEDFNIDDVKIAVSPSDDMSFSAAFAAARKEVGPHGVFEWRGGVYGTYYADEWNNFSPEYKSSFSNANWQAEFAERRLADRFSDNDHVSVVNHDDSHGGSAHHDADDVPVTIDKDDINPALQGHKIHLTPDGIPYVSLTDAQTGEEVRISPFEDDFIAFDKDGNYVGQIDIQSKTEYDQEHNVEVVSPVMKDEIEGQPVAVAGVRIDGTENILVDVDDDGNFDRMITNNGTDQPDVYDISGAGITQDDINNSFQEKSEGQYLNEQNLPDYSNDNDVSSYTIDV
jgi:hypothetical protein